MGGREVRYTYRLDVDYVYTVGGSEYQSNKSSIQLTDHQTHQAAEEDLISFPEGGNNYGQRFVLELKSECGTVFGS